MTEVMTFFILSTVILFTVGVLSGLVFSLPAFHLKFTKDTAKLLLLTRIASLLSVLSPLVFCIFSQAETLDSAMNLASVLYAMFAGMRLLALVVGFLPRLFAHLAGKKIAGPRAVRNLFYISETVACAVCALLAWLTKIA